MLSSSGLSWHDPDLYINAMPGMDDDLIRTCDACNKTNRPARFDFVLSGEAYENDTLEAVDNSDDEDEYDDAASRDEKGHVLAKQTQHFYLGSHCAANAQMGHKLTPLEISPQRSRNHLPGRARCAVCRGHRRS